MLAQTQLVLGEVHDLHRRDEFHRMAPVDGLEQEGVAHPVLIMLLRCVFLAVGILTLAAGVEFGPHEGGQGTVSGAVGKDLAGEENLFFRSQLIALDALDLPVDTGGRVHGTVQVQIKIFLLLGRIKKHGIPDGEIIAVIDPLVGKHQLMDDTTLGQFGFFVIGRSAANVHPDLAAGVAAQHRPVLHQRRPGSVPGSRQGCTQARHAAADHDKIIIGKDCFESVHIGEPPNLLSSPCPVPYPSFCRFWAHKWPGP